MAVISPCLFTHKKLHGKDCARADVMKPEAVVKRRLGQTLCIFQQSENEQTAEWVDDEDIDVEGLESILVCSQDEPSIPIISSISEWLQNPWTNEKD